LVYRVAYAEGVEKDFLKSQRLLRKKILDKIENYLALDPQGFGKPLTGIFKGFWRYRFGDYRVIYRIAPKEILIVVIN
jgi:mRNA interferase RelE/StbE